MELSFTLCVEENHVRIDVTRYGRLGGSSGTRLKIPTCFIPLMNRQ